MLERDGVLAFIESCRLPEAGPGCYRYSLSTTRPTLYSSCYAAMARDLLSDLDVVPVSEREAWAAYLNEHQDEDGLYRDPVIFGQGWYEGDPLWCGRPHLTCHVVTALACLGFGTRLPLGFLEPWKEAGFLERWLSQRDWGERVAFSGNEIMNIGVLLQYARDFHGDSRAGAAVESIIAWLEGHHLDPATGVWGAVDVGDPLWRSQAVQAAYHWWPLWSYDGLTFPFVRRAVDTVLATQNAAGGFGWGGHNPEDPLVSSACEEIDSIEPLARMLGQTSYRSAEARAALSRAVDWVLSNQTPDGGFVFSLGRDFEYGHRQLLGRAGQGAMFPTWFRLLSLAFLAASLRAHPLRQLPWRYVRCPGMQFAP